MHKVCIYFQLCTFTYYTFTLCIYFQLCTFTYYTFTQHMGIGCVCIGCVCIGCVCIDVCVCECMLGV